MAGLKDLQNFTSRREVQPIYEGTSMGCDHMGGIAKQQDLIAQGSVVQVAHHKAMARKNLHDGVFISYKLL